MTYISIIITSILLVSKFSTVNGEVPKKYHLVNIKEMLPRDICSSYQDSTTNQAKGLKVVHRHGPCSPAATKRQENDVTHGQILDNDRVRVEYLHHKNSPTTTTESLRTQPRASLASANIPANTGTSYGTGNYLVKMGFGTPRKDQTVIFDTGSDVTWIQCEPCVGVCYEQTDPIFDPSKSSTYKNITCASSYCDELDVNGCASGTCLYGVQYGDNSFTVGFFAQETLSTTQSDKVYNFRFGCGEKNEGLFGEAAGLLGLGREKVSFVSQTYQTYGGVFSYCLPATSSSTGYLSFGSGSGYTSNVKYTPMLTVANTPTFYYLNLVAISVGGKKLPVQPTVFAAGGTIIDSGTVITRLPPTAYSALRTAFRQAMSKYKSAPALSILDTCYDLTGVSTLIIPTITLSFGGGATMDLDASGELYVSKISQACLAFAANSKDSDLTIIGNTQQRKLNVVYDNSKKLIGFGPGSC